jgi:pSer/pThr/pTyr-binding forkhead associated (FHA) protein
MIKWINYRFTFLPKNSPITIGRVDCNINLNDEYLSKNHCTIKYKENNWILSDGYENKFSKNGTWYFL